MGYRQPRKLNIVSVALLLLFAAAGYWLWLFFPVYWDAWTVDHQLREAAAALYQLNKLAEPTRTVEIRKLLRKVQADCIRLAHISDPSFDVSVDMMDDNVVLRAEYSVDVKHPVGNWVTTVELKRAQKANVKRVQWD